MNPDYMKVITTKGRAIPGQSLTADRDNPAPYERPPKYTNIHAASEYIFEILIESDRYESVMNMLSDGVPVMNVVQTILFAGFTSGKWNPDLMLLLVEPTAYIILALAERAGIDPMITEDDEDDDIEEDYMINGAKFKKEKLDRLRKAAATDTIPKGALPADLMQKLNTVEPPSMMEKPTEEPTPTPEGESLLAPSQPEAAPTEEEEMQ